MSGLTSTASVRQPHLVSAAVPSPQARPLGPVLVAMTLLTLGLALAFERPGYPLLGLLLALSFSTFVLRVNSPALVLVPVLVVELTIASYFNTSLGMGQRMPVIVGATALAASMILRGRLMGDRVARRIVVPAIVFIGIATVANAMYSGDDYVTKYLRYQAAQLLALVLVACVIRYRHDLVRISLAALAIGVATGLAAMWQHYAPLSAPFGGENINTLRFYNSRAVGLAPSPVLLASQMIFVIPPLLGVLLCGPWRIDRKRIMLGGCLFVLAGGLNFTYTRSAVFGLVPAIAIMALYLSGRRRLLILGGVLAAGLVFQLAAGTGLIGDRYYEDASTDDRSASVHDTLWQVGFAVALDHAVTGIGHEHFEEVALGYVDVVEDDAAVGAIGEERPHNDFLSVWISWGIFGLIAYIGIFLGTLRNAHLAAKSDDLLIRGLALGCIGGVVAYGVNSLYHNSLDSTMFLWLYAGASIVLARFAAQSRRVGHGQPISNGSPVWRN